MPVLERIKHAYSIWYGFYHKIPKTHRHTLGVKIDAELVTIIETIAYAVYLPRNEKISWVQLAIRKLESVKILLLILWENKSLETKQYVTLSLPLDDVGKMLGGWHGQLVRQNSPARAEEK